MLTTLSCLYAEHQLSAVNNKHVNKRFLIMKSRHILSDDSSEHQSINQSISPSYIDLWLLIGQTGCRRTLQTTTTKNLTGSITWTNKQTNKDSLTRLTGLGRTPTADTLTFPETHRVSTRCSATRWWYSNTWAPSTATWGAVPPRYCKHTDKYYSTTNMENTAFKNVVFF